MRKVELLPTRDCEAGYGPGWYSIHFMQLISGMVNSGLYYYYLYCHQTNQESYTAPRDYRHFVFGDWTTKLDQLCVQVKYPFHENPELGDL